MMKWRLGAALAMSAALLVGCDDDDDDPIAPILGTADVRVVHASGAAPAVNVTADDESIASNLAFSQSSAYVEVDEGERTFTVTEVGGTAAAFDTTRTLDEGDEVTFLVVGDATGLSSIILDDNNTPPATGMFRARVVHASPSAGAVDVYVTEPDADLATATPVLTNVAYGDFETLTEAAAGDYQVRVVATGTTDIVVDMGTLTIPEGGVRTIVVTDNIAGEVETVTAFTLTDL